jgi:hypothetical protein
MSTAPDLVDGNAYSYGSVLPFNHGENTWNYIRIWILDYILFKINFYYSDALPSSRSG